MTTKTTLIKTTAIFVFLLISLSFANAQVAISELGYHPLSAKQVVWYTSTQAASFTINDASTNLPVTELMNFEKPANGCQGGRECLVGDFSDFSQSGNFYIFTPGGNSPSFEIGNGVYKDTAPLFLEFFNAHLQQNSAYHGDFHSSNNPRFLSMADGSFIMKADQAALPLIRLGSAYRRNPSLFDIDNYQISTGGKDDIGEYVHNYVEYLRGLQLNSQSGNFDVSFGWHYDFHCWPEVDLNGMWNTETDSCQSFQSTTDSHLTIITLLAYLESLPALNEYSPAYAQSLFTHSKNMYNYIKANYGAISGNDAGFLGAAEFLLYDYTNNPEYLRSAHARKDGISETFISDTVKGNEFYWEEYVRHKSDISANNLSPYTYKTTTVEPESFFLGKMIQDYYNEEKAMSKTGEKVYQFANDVLFQNSRFMLVEAILSAKNIDLNGARFENKDLDKVADYQLAWLSGMNSVQMGSQSTSPASSISFIFGIGNDPVAFHSLMVPRETYGNVNFKNGLNYIPGWINGAFDADGDGTFNYVDSTGSWEYTETTNEMVATALELYAYLDGQYNANPRASRILFEEYTPPVPPANNTNNTPQQNNTNPEANTNSNCHSLVNTLPVNCSGTITNDTNSGCRSITCSQGNSSMKVLACNKPDSGTPQFFEITQNPSTTAIQICLGNTCITNQGYVKGDNFPICFNQSSPPVNNQDNNPPANNQNTNSGSSPPSSSSGGGGRGGGGGGAFRVCQYKWECANWSSCVLGLETRQCAYTKVSQYTQKTQCPSEFIEPETSRDCEVKEDIETQEEIETFASEENFDGLEMDDSDISGLMDISEGTSVDVNLKLENEDNSTLVTGALSFLPSGNKSGESLFRPRDLIIAGFIVAFVLALLLTMLFKRPKIEPSEIETTEKI